MTKAINEAQSLHSLGEEARPVTSPGTVGSARQLDDFETIYRQHYGSIWRFLLHLGVRRSDVQDVTHNVFLIAYSKLSEFEHRSTVRTWLCGIAFRVARDFMRSAAVRLEVSSEDAPVPELASAHDSAESLGQKRRLALAMQLLEALPTEQREVFVLHELEHLTGPEIAELMGTPANTVRSRLKRARDTFRERVAELRAKGGGEIDV